MKSRKRKENALWNKIEEAAKNRLLLMFTGIVFLFVLLSARLYSLQVVHGRQYQEKIRITTIRTLPEEAQRGNIYDRFGIPLAENTADYCIKYDLNVETEDLNAMFLDLFEEFHNCGITYTDDFPITEEMPFAFTFSSQKAEERWKKDMGMKADELSMTADETMVYLKKKFNLPRGLTAEAERRLLSVRSKLFLQRYKKYNSVLISEEANQEIIAVIEEHGEKYPGIYIEAETKRCYPQGEAFSHILGYVGSINEEELDDYDQYGYSQEDKIGKLGIEKAYELVLRGENGKRAVEVDAQGRRVGEEQVQVPVKGGDIILTIDSRLQNETYHILENNLKDVLLARMNGGEVNETDIIKAMIQSNAVSVSSILSSQAGEVQYEIRHSILNAVPSYKGEDAEDLQRAKDYLCSAVEKGEISLIQMLQVMEEQKIISLQKEDKYKLTQGILSPYQLLREKIEEGEIPVHQLNMDPCTGSAVVLDVNSGEVLAMVTYPSYDNNQLVNQFNEEYYNKLLSDPTTPLINRPAMERKAPGSTFKMLSAVTGLETGTITPNTLIRDEGVYREAGLPYPKCLIYSNYGITHGMVDVRKALEVSCNYFFYELAYRMGNAKNSTTLNAINNFEEYMQKFGLDKVSGIEIEESAPKMASPQLKASIAENTDENAAEGQKKWMDGDSIRCAIGQSYNSFAAIHVAKYISAVANGGTRVKTSLIKGIKEKESEDTLWQEAVMEEELNLKEDTLKAVCEGMYLVTHGSQGTLRSYFSDYPIEVAAKTGTAEEAKTRPSHSWFAGFAPYEEPGIAVVVMIPFGESSHAPAIKTAKGIISAYFDLENTDMPNRYVNSLVQ